MFYLSYVEPTQNSYVVLYQCWTYNNTVNVCSESDDDKEQEKEDFFLTSGQPNSGEPS